jgi:hypothetical protein
LRVGKLGRVEDVEHLGAELDLLPLTDLEILGQREVPVEDRWAYNGASKTATLVVNPPLASILLNPTTVTGGATSTGTVTLSSVAPAGGAVVTLTSSNVNVATVPASVTVAAGVATGTFTITSNPVTAASAVTITATYSGGNKTATLNVNPTLALMALTVNPPL